MLLALLLLALNPPSLARVDAIELSANADGLDGKIELLEDARFHPAMSETWWGQDGAMVCDEWQKYGDAETRELCASIEQSPLLPATIRLLDASGKVLDERRFDRELAKLEPAALLYGSKRRTFLVTVDYGIGFGSYAGPMTYLVEPRDKKLQWLKARDKSGSVSEPQLVRTLKSEWRLARRADGLGQDILAVQCRPDFEREESASSEPGGDLPFLIHFFRYHFDGKSWIESERTEPGFWEDEGEFPSADRFP
jgi:hypothetical protein